MTHTSLQDKIPALSVELRTARRWEKVALAQSGEARAGRLALLKAKQTIFRLLTHCERQEALMGLLVPSWFDRWVARKEGELCHHTVSWSEIMGVRESQSTSSM